MDSNYSFEPQTKMKSRKKTNFISIILSIIGILILCCNEIIDENFNRTLSINNVLITLLLMMLGIGAILAIPLFIIYRFKSINIRANGILIISLLFLLLQTRFFVYGFTERNQSTEASSFILQITNNAMNNKKTSIQTFPESKYGKNATVLPVLVKATNNIVENNLKYQGQLSSLNVAKYMNKEMLSNKDTINKAISEVSGLKNNFIETQENNKAILDDLKETIANLNMSKSYINSAILGIDYSLNFNQEFQNKYITTEVSILDNYIKMFNFFNSLNGKLKIENETYIFNNSDDLDEYNKIISDFNNLKKEEKKLLSEMDTRRRNILNKAESQSK